MIKKDSIEISGRNIEGKFVVSNAFYLGDTKGIPLSICVEELHKKNMIIDWVKYIQDSTKHNHKPKRIKNRILESVSDVFGPEYRGKFKTELDKFL